MSMPTLIPVQGTKMPKPQFSSPNGVKLLVSDNPWYQNNRRATRRDNPEGKSRFGIGAHSRYELESGFGCMKTRDLCALGEAVQKICHEDCYLFQWCTAPMFYPDAFQVMESWGFRYITIAFVWVKLYYPSMESFMGPGGYTFSNVEFVLLGGRGRQWHYNGPGCVKAAQEIVQHIPPDEWEEHDGFAYELPNPVDRRVHPRRDNKIDHSVKPEEMQDRLERWLGSSLGPHDKKVELFARRQRPGWECYGAALSGRDIAQDLQDLRDQQEMEQLFHV